MPRVIEGLQAVTVHVTDLRRAREFYSRVLGLEEERPLPNVPRAVFKIPGSSTRLLMHVQSGDEGGRAPGTVSGILFHCSDPVAATVVVKENGGSIVDEPWTMHRGESAIVRVVVADPDGNEFILSSAL
jgi:predicted enzyme related to lactoylglutathione lyase